MSAAEVEQYCTELPVQGRILKAARAGFSAYHYVGRFRQQCLIASEKLPDQPFDPVAHDCVARPFAYGESKTAQAEAVFMQVAFKVR